MWQGRNLPAYGELRHLREESWNGMVFQLYHIDGAFGDVHMGGAVIAGV